MIIVIMIYDREDELEVNAERVRWKIKNRDEEFTIFSRSGFDSEIVTELDERWHLYDLERLETVFFDG